MWLPGAGPRTALTAQTNPAQGQFSNTQGASGYGRMGVGLLYGVGGPPGMTDDTEQQGTAPTPGPTTAPAGTAATQAG